MPACIFLRHIVLGRKIFIYNNLKIIQSQCTCSMLMTSTKHFCRMHVNFGKCYIFANLMSYNKLVGAWTARLAVLFSISCQLSMKIFITGFFITWPKVIKLLSCSTQLRMKFIMSMNVKMPTIAEISIDFFY